MRDDSVHVRRDHEIMSTYTFNISAGGTFLWFPVLLALLLGIEALLYCARWTSSPSERPLKGYKNLMSNQNMSHYIPVQYTALSIQSPSLCWL